MATVKDLRAQAKAAGITGYSKMNKAALEEALAAGGAPAAEPEKGDRTPAGGTPGIPTEPEKANLTATEKRALKKIGGRPTLLAAANAGKPTEPERGGVTAKDLNQAGAFTAAKKEKPGPPPPITGNAGKPTEPDRGGVNKLERELSGAA
jgi:hypothetical protein